MSLIARTPQRWRCRPIGAAAAIALALLLAACQGGLPPDETSSGQNADALMRVADETRAGGDPGTAANLYRRVHELRPTDSKPLAKLGSTLTQLGAYTEAAQSFRAGLDLSPHDPDLHRGLSVVLLSLNQPEAAIREADKALAKKSDDPRLYNILGVAHDLMGRHELAQEDYLNGLRVAPKSAGLRNNYGLSLALSGDFGAAASALSEIADDPASPPRYRLNLALIYGLAGDDKKASATARTALDEAAVRNNLAYYNMLRHMNDKARTAAIIAGQLHGTPTEPPPPEQNAAANDAQSRPLAPSPAASADKDSSAAPSAAPAASSDASAAAASSDASAPDTSAASTEAPAANAEASGPPVKLTPSTAADSDAQPPAAAADATAPASSAPAATDAAAATSPATDAAAAAPATDAAPAAAAAAASAPAADAAMASPSDTGAAAPTGEAAQSPQPIRPHKPSDTLANGGFVVQFGSFSIEANARKLADQLGQKGYRAAVVRHRDHEGREWYAVRGQYPSAAEAVAAARRIHDSDQLPAVVLRRPTQAQS